MLIQKFSLEELECGSIKDTFLKFNDFKKLSVEEMLNDIEETNHKNERRLIQEVNELFQSVNNDSQELKNISNKFKSMTADLLNHFDKEEKEVFPLMRQQSFDFSIMAKITELENEHLKQQDQQTIIGQLINLFIENQIVTSDIQNTFDKINELFADISEHLEKEEVICFSKYEG